ncbi:LOW QUALITY PROTEIN: hypothetical protein Cgig2_008623 [Carnegiea gigantea]|uniref:Uncharacterized protein n=1 Tax=Carnegiea gigantea TaxID=171969 RepID=A0A9Q1K1K3_9CARY|nr:LOW QUALITY PROTEIN: hypothetical protein Cgig2_008623 [Carnegiea gigantea]
MKRDVDQLTSDITRTANDGTQPKISIMDITCEITGDGSPPAIKVHANPSVGFDGFMIDVVFFYSGDEWGSDHLALAETKVEYVLCERSRGDLCKYIRKRLPRGRLLIKKQSRKTLYVMIVYSQIYVYSNSIGLRGLRVEHTSITGGKLNLNASSISWYRDSILRLATRKQKKGRQCRGKQSRAQCRLSSQQPYPKPTIENEQIVGGAIRLINLIRTFILKVYVAKGKMKDQGWKMLR